jgi:hypothetical protein
MTPSPDARPKAPQRPRKGGEPSTAPPGSRPRGRPPAGAEGGKVRELPGVTVRVTPELLARIDAEVARRNEASRPKGYSTSRGAVMALALEEFCAAAERAAAEQTSGGAS